MSGLGVAVLLAVGVPASGQDAPSPAAALAAQVASLRSAVGSGGKVATDPGTGLVTFTAAAPGKPVVAAAAASTPEDAARAYLKKYGKAYGVDDVNDLVVKQVVKSATGGRSTVRFSQRRNGIPAVAAGLSVALDSSLAVKAVTADLLPRGAVSTTATVTAAQAQAAARKAVANAHRLAVAKVTASKPTQGVYNPAVLGGPGAKVNSLVWQLRVDGSGAEGPFHELTVVDARTGAVLQHFDTINHQAEPRHSGRDRRTCNDSNAPMPEGSCIAGTSKVVRNETSLHSNDPEIDLAHDYTGDTYNFYFSRFHRDSLDGKGLPLYSEVRFCYDAFDCPYANAFWNGTQMTYGDGYAAADDVVGHELTHGFTEFTSGLIYFQESGAINESMSDIFGELIDLTNRRGNDTPAARWLEGEDLPIGAIRNMANPPALGQPDRTQSPLYFEGSDDAGGVHTNSGIGNKAAYLITDGGTFNGRTVSGLGITRAADIYYEVETSLLQPASNYQDLAVALPQACRNLIGTDGITEEMCGEVLDAVKATQMDVAHVHVPLVAPRCGTGVQTNLFSDPIAAGAPGWTQDLSAGGTWTVDTTRSHSAPRDLNREAVGTISDSAIRRTAPISVPVGVATYLVFQGLRDFEADGWDGGVIEYDVVGDADGWLDAGTLIDFNGYNGIIGEFGDFGNPLDGRAGFVSSGVSYDETRIDLSAFPGSDVLLRFRVGTDSIVGTPGWFIDDVSAFTCGPTPVRR
jgi:bacillolysin